MISGSDIISGVTGSWLCQSTESSWLKCMQRGEQSLWETRSKGQHKEEELLHALLKMHNHVCHTPDTPAPLAVGCIKWLTTSSLRSTIPLTHDIGLWMSSLGYVLVLNSLLKTYV